MEPPSTGYNHTWTPIGETPNQLIVYHPPSHAIQVVPHPDREGAASTGAIEPDDVEEQDEGKSRDCPLCHRPWSPVITPTARPSRALGRGDSSYFRVLERAHGFSQPGTPIDGESNRESTTPIESIPTSSADDMIDVSDLPAMGYYRRFFKEEARLGIGAEGSVYLATHVIGGNVLGTYAVKKIAVGTSKTYLVRMLREVRLLEALRHPNIIPYYHSWVDETQFSSFSPPILALHVLMMYASAGNLDAFLINRSHAASVDTESAGGLALNDDFEHLPKAERIKAFKRRRQSGVGRAKGESRGVLLLGLEEMLKLFGDVVEGLAFLHSNSILHLDLKCSNVLLHWEEGEVTPKAMLSDFGTSEEMIRGRRQRTGHTGTLEYMAPETIVMDVNGDWRPSDSHADMWSLGKSPRNFLLTRVGMILHKMLFLKLPYQASDDLAALHDEIVRYRGFHPTPEVIEVCERRHIPREMLLLLEKLLDLSPEQRPNAERVRLALSRFHGTGLGNKLGNLWKNKFRDKKRHEKRAADRSPVRSLLALPSPPGYPEVRVAPAVPVGAGEVEGVEWRKYAWLALFTLKVMSLQPNVLGVQLPPAVVLCLVIMAVVDLPSHSASLALSGGLLLIHVSALVSAKLNA